MTDFAFTELVDVGTKVVYSAALGGGTGSQFGNNDLKKPVKLSTANNYVLATAGEEIEGFVNSVEPFTVNGGYTFGGVQTSGRMIAKVGAAQSGTLTVGEFAVAAGSSALGTKDEYPLVVQGTPATFKWRVIRVVSGTGVAGDLVLLERAA